MDAAFGLTIAVGELAFDEEGGAFDAGAFTGEGVSEVGFPSAGFAPALVHAEEHAGPVAGFGAAGAGVDAEDAVVAVVGAVEEDAKFAGLEIASERLEVALDFLKEGRLAAGGFGLAEFDHDAEIVELFLRLAEGFDASAEGIGLLDQLLGLIAILPEAFEGHLGFDFAEAFLYLGDVKETSAGDPVYRRRFRDRFSRYQT
jgi:hypothetical protein